MFSASATVAALHSNRGVPSVNLRNAVGISIVTAIFVSSISKTCKLYSWRSEESFLFPGARYQCGSSRSKLRFHIRLERFQLRRNRLRQRILRRNRVGGL